MIDDESTGLFEGPNLTGTPERRLLLAVLERAILDYVGNEDREVEAAKEWLFGDLDEQLHTEFSFPWVCRELDLDIATVVTKIRSMPRRGSNRIAPWYFSKNRQARPTPAVG
jgi:hypothetical protein